MKKSALALSGALALLSVAEPARAGCTLSQVLELPVTMEGHSPVVTATVNGEAVRFELDSGAFYSTMSPGTAAQLRLKLSPAPFGFSLVGVGGETAKPSVTTVKSFGLGTVKIPNIQFLVAGNEFGHGGLLGQNLFARFDVEYDLAHGAIRFFHSNDCGKSVIAYWAKDQNFSTVKIQSVLAAEYHTVGDIELDGARIAAVFDTGAATSILSLQAAAKAGVRPNSPGVEDGGYSYGVGRGRVRTWIGRFKSIRIGDGEEIKNIRIRFGDMDNDGAATMLMGADFFLSHRVMVDNDNHRLFLTYNGGPVFNLSFDPAEGEKPTAAAALAGPDPTDADGWSRRGAGYLARRDVPRATADLRQAVKLAPGVAIYHRQLATALLAADKKADAMKELDAAIAAKADDADSLLMRAWLRIDDDRQGAERDADAWAAAMPRQAHGRLELGGLYERLHAPSKSVRAYSDWIDTHPTDVAMAEALNGRCWTRGLANTELDLAMADCDRAIRLTRKASGVVDSRALIWFRKGDLARARADYDAAIAADPKAASSLFMRAVVEAKAGDKPASEKDLAAAKALNKDSGELFADWGIKP